VSSVMVGARSEEGIGAARNPSLRGGDEDSVAAIRAGSERRLGRTALWSWEVTDAKGIG
jgi:hypothetical protein